MNIGILGEDRGGGLRFIHNSGILVLEFWGGIAEEVYVLYTIL